MTTHSEQKRRLFSGDAAAATLYLRACAYGVLVCAMSLMAYTLLAGFKWSAVGICIVAGMAVAGVAIGLTEAAGKTWKRLAVDGSSTPYEDQFSFQHSLLMQRRIDEALASFEVLMVEQPQAVGIRIRVAEIYAKEKGDFRRAAELFREAQMIPAISSGDDIYARYRLVDLLLGPLKQPGKAMVELRRLIEQHPGTSAANQARLTLGHLKAELSEEHS